MFKYAPVPRHERPLLAGLAAEMIAQSFHVAQRGDTGAQNFERLTPAERRYSRLASAHALRWIRARTNWTRIPLEKRLRAWGSPAPPREVRDEYAGSFDWCCELLNLDPDGTRRNGCPVRPDHKSRWLIRGGLSDWRQWRATRGGAHPVYREKHSNVKSDPVRVVVPQADAPTTPAVDRIVPDACRSPYPRRQECNFTFQFGHELPAGWRRVPIVSSPCRTARWV